MLDRGDIETIKNIIADRLDLKITQIINMRMDQMEEKFKKLEKIDSIINDIKSLFQ